MKPRKLMSPQKKAMPRVSVLRSSGPAMIEKLEDRCLLSLIGIGIGVPLEYPVVTYDSTGAVTYDATADTFDEIGTPLTFKQSATTAPKTVNAPRSMVLQVAVDQNGQIPDGGASSIFELIGSIGTEYSGTLLTGKVVQFGYENTAPLANGTDTYDFRVVPTGGALLPLFANKDIGIEMTSEHSSFGGSFTVDFAGGAKGTIGAIEQLASLGDYVWVDFNANGVQDDGATGVRGVMVNLLRPGADQTPGTGDDILVASAVTDAAGGYLFGGLTPGDYFVQFAAPPNMTFTAQAQGGDRAADSNAAQATGRTGVVTLAAGQTDWTIDAGLLLPEQGGGQGLTPGFWKQTQHFGAWVGYNPYGSMYDQAFGVDAPGNRTLLDALKLGGGGEKALARHAVAALLNASSNNVDYRYSVDQVILMVRYAYANGEFEKIKNLLAAQNELEGVDGGSICQPLSSIAGTVYLDKDNDGAIDKKEAGLVGVTIRLTGVDIWGNTINRLVQTDRTGGYTFDGLNAGTYAITEVQPTGYADGKDTLGNAGGVLGSDCFTNIVLAGAKALGYNFGEHL